MKRHQYTAVAAAAVCAFFASFAPQAQAQADGTFFDEKTGLTWMRCPLQEIGTAGEVLTNCYGKGFTFGEVQALAGKSLSFAGYNDWRVPNIRELNSIVVFSKTFNYAVNGNAVYFSSGKIYPSYPLVWSNTPFAGDSSLGWTASFYTGMNFPAATTAYVPIGRSGEGFDVRLVRGGQPLGLLNPARPDEDYQNHGDGTVTHQPTGLMWKRCMEGQQWSGSTCVGTASQLTWAIATTTTSNFAGKTDWRLPTVKELQTLLDYTKEKPDPTLNTTIFPNDPALYVWSNSNYISTEYKWRVDFSNAMLVEANSLPESTAAVRLVREIAPEPPTDINCLFNWAESRVPHLFAPAHTPTQTTAAISYRAYANNVFLWVNGSDNAVWVYYGGRDIPINVGDLADFLPITRATACQ